MERAEECRTLAIDIGGSGIKLALLDGAGKMIGERVRVPTPPPPAAPQLVTDMIDQAAAPLGHFDRASVGFPGMVRHGRVLTAPHLGTEAWAGYDLQTELSRRWGKPVRVMNDADVQGFGAIRGVGVEMVVTLGTGCGTAIFADGKVIPHLELSHHPIRSGQTYDEYVGRAALDKIGKKKWNRRVARVIDVLRTVVAFDHLYIGGGNAKHLKIELPDDVSIVPNSSGLIGGFALWHEIDAARLAQDAHAPRPQPHGDRRNAADPGRVRRARGRLRLPRARLRHGGAVSVCRSARLYAAARGRQRALGAAAGAASVARRDRAAERLRHRQFLHDRRHAPARCGPRPRRRGDRRGDFGCRTRRDAPGRHPRRARQSRNRRRERPRSGAASAGRRGGAGRGAGLACPGLYAAAGDRGA